MSCATAAGPSVPAGVLTNASSDVCLPARSCIQQVCARSMSHKSLRPCCFRFMTRTAHVSAMRRDAVPSGLKQMAQIELRKTTEWPGSPPHKHFACSYMINDTRKRHLPSTVCILGFRKIRYGLWRHSFALVCLK